MNDIEQMLINEYHKIQRAIGARKAQISTLEKKIKAEPSMLTHRPKRYSVEFTFAPGDLQPQQRTFLVDGGTKFRVKTIETSLRVVGVANVATGGLPVPGQTAQLTLGYGRGNGLGQYRNEYFDFEWRIRDTGADREWQDEKQPSVFLMSGHLSPLWLPIPGLIDGGAEVAIEIDPVFSRIVAGSNVESLFETVTNYVLHFSFHGEEGRL